MDQPVTEGYEAALNLAAERIAEGLLADIESALANPAVRAVVAAERLEEAAFNAVLRRVTARFAALTRPRRKTAAASG